MLQNTDLLKDNRPAVNCVSDKDDVNIMLCWKCGVCEDSERGLLPRKKKHFKLQHSHLNCRHYSSGSFRRISPTTPALLSLVRPQAAYNNELDVTMQYIWNIISVAYFLFLPMYAFQTDYHIIESGAHTLHSYFSTPLALATWITWH
jgi:hypothetical protein